jgi:threonine dehydrogenase-like Zn-dependent dehydrogenase
VLIEPTACAVHAAEVLRSLSPTSVAVLGSGSLGLLTLAAISHLARPGGLLLASAKYPAQRELARALGADRVVEPAEVARVVRSATASFVLGGEQLTGGVDCVVDCVGSAASLGEALKVVSPGGTVLLVGMPGHVHVDLTSLWHRESAIRGCYAYTADDFATAASLVADADLGRLLSATYPLARYREAIEHAANAGSRGSVKIAFDMRHEKERNR